MLYACSSAVEHSTDNRKVIGSNPIRRIKLLTKNNFSDMMVVVAQLVEHSVVVRRVANSNFVVHPKRKLDVPWPTGKAPDC